MTVNVIGRKIIDKWGNVFDGQHKYIITGIKGT